MEDAAQDVTNQLCKLRLIVGDKSVEMALPADVPLVDLLPAILRHAGSDLADQGVEHDGWVLQRLGKAPLDENRTPSELGLLDGESVHLRPRAAAYPEIDFDDLVDGIAEQTRRRSDAWNDRFSSGMLLAFSGMALLAGALVLLLDGPLLPRAIGSGIAAAFLLIAGSALARGRGNTAGGAMLALAGSVYTGLFGWLLPQAFHAGTAPSLACAGVLVVATLIVGIVGVGSAGLLFAGGLFSTVLLSISAIAAAVFPLQSGQAAAIGLALTLLALGIVPTSAFRLAGLSLPPLPTSSEEFGQDTDPVPYREVVDRTELANRYMTWISAALGTTAAALFTVVLSSTTPWSMTMAAVAALLLLLRSRNIIGTYHRWALLAPAGYAAVLDGTALATQLPGLARVGVFAGAVVVALILLVCSASLPGRKLRPYWGRAVDVLETLCAVALFPLLLAVLDVYTLVRGMSGA